MNDINSSWQDKTESPVSNTLIPDSQNQIPNPIRRSQRAGLLFFMIVLMLGIGAATTYFVLYSKTSPEKKVEDAIAKTFEQTSIDVNIETNIKNRTDQNDSPFKTNAIINVLVKGLNIKSIRDDAQDLSNSQRIQGSFTIKGTFGGLALSVDSDYIVLKNKIFLRFSELVFATSALSLTDFTNKWLFLDTQESQDVIQNFADQPIDNAVCLNPQALEYYFMETGFIKSVGIAKKIDLIQTPDEQATRYEIVIEKEKVNQTLSKIKELGGCDQDLVESLSSDNLRSLIIAIGNKSGLIKKIEVNLTNPANLNDDTNTLEVITAVNLSNFNFKPIINEPKNATSLEQILTEIFSGEESLSPEDELLPMEL